jgi:Resolvase, N terminal domain
VNQPTVAPFSDGRIDLGGIIAQEVCPLIPEDEAGPRRICQRVLVRAEPPTGPQLQAMLACLAEDPSIDCLVVHKLDRLAWNLEDRRGQGRASKGLRATALVTESLEDSASGKLVEGILASIAEFYSPISARRSARASTRRRRMVVSRPCPPSAIGTSDTRPRAPRRVGAGTRSARPARRLGVPAVRVGLTVSRLPHRLLGREGLGNRLGNHPGISAIHRTLRHPALRWRRP